ncbi:MAG: aspartate kinase [Armatimonadetes bacterium RBG_16_67_12]|nr:MAG: aspartate kinase [Armatimonadetes bacterium RBG_16_67_12]
MALIVQKYGGSSVATTEKLRHVAQRVAATRRRGAEMVVVVSAPGDMTDDLLGRAREISPQPPARELDMLLAVGEQVSISLLSMALQALGEQAISLTGSQVRILTDGVHTKARVLEVDRRRIDEELSRGRIVVVAGFQGVTPDHEITTLGRGGSDLSAVALASALGAEACEIYTDVPGVFTADPRIVPEARQLSRLSYDEMLEMASSGAVVLQTRSVEYAKSYGVRLHVRSTWSDAPGTIVEEVPEVERIRLVTGVAHDTNVAKITIRDLPDMPGIAHRIFSALAERHINVDMIVQTASRDGRADISFTVTKTDAPAAEETTRAVGREIGAGEVAAGEGVAKVSIVGAGMASNPGVAAALFGALAAAGVNIQMISTSEIKVSCIIPVEDVQKAVRAVHRAFNLDALR